jgi:antitoxin ParD1/3/4
VKVSLTPELEKLVQAKIASGRFHSADEVVEEALHLLAEQEIKRDSDLQELRAQMDQALAEADRGDVADGEKFMQRMLDELDLEEANRKTG